MFKSKFISLLVGLSAVGVLTACGGGTPAFTTISIAFGAAPPASLALNTTANISAVVQNDNAARGVTWSVKCARDSMWLCRAHEHGQRRYDDIHTTRAVAIAGHRYSDGDFGD